MQRICATCDHYEFDDWYQTERVCGCKNSPKWGEPMKTTDTCDCWEEQVTNGERKIDH